MRIFMVIVLISAFSVWRDAETASVDVSAPPPGAAPVEDDGGPLLASLGSLWREGSEAEERPPDPVVHCRLADEDTFVRRSTCERAGGWPDEPGWARLD
ncbi:MAG: hypothetical protein QNK04_14670 [Myxococcota bacterium]|nr:hypothetical protein [Myxococcota bacterium]